MLDLKIILQNARTAGLAVPAFNVPYLPMIEPIVQAVVDTNGFAMIETARLEWIKLAAGGPEAVAREFFRCHNPDHLRLHLDHVPVIDEDGVRVDYLAIIQKAIGLGYHSVMVDGSRLSLRDNICATREVVNIAHQAGIPCEAELGTIFGHESGPIPQYDELFDSGKGFTSVDEARQFVLETGCDWLSVAIGSFHGAISQASQGQKKIAARLDLDHLEKLYHATAIPLVLHGGSGIPREYVLEAFSKGIAKINVATDIRQVYQSSLQSSGKITIAQDAVYQQTKWMVGEFFDLSNTYTRLVQEAA